MGCVLARTFCVFDCTACRCSLACRERCDASTHPTNIPYLPHASSENPHLRSPVATGRRDDGRRLQPSGRSANSHDPSRQRLAALAWTPRRWQLVRSQTARDQWPAEAGLRRHVERNHWVADTQALIVVGDRLYTIDRQMEPAAVERVLCFHAEDGKLLWSHEDRR